MKRHLQPHARTKQAFALTDLAALVAIISLVGLVQLPSLGRNEEGSSSATCLDNLRHLAQAWLMYSDDHAGELVPNHGNATDRQTWARGWFDFTSSSDNTNLTFLVNPEAHLGMTGLLGPYLQRNPRYFLCPSDRSTVSIGGRDHRRVRSVSMNNWMGGTAYCGQGPYFKEYRRQSEIITPASRFVFIEERPDSINDGWHPMRMQDENLVDYPGFFHASGAWISFADGHVEHRRWTDPRMIPAYSVNELLPLQVPMPGNADVVWLKVRTTDPIPQPAP